VASCHRLEGHTLAGILDLLLIKIEDLFVSQPPRRVCPMRLPCMTFASQLAAAVLALCPASPAIADDTEDFLKPDNWVGRADVWKIEKGSIVGETKEDLKYNTFFVSKAKYSDFELSFKVQLRDGVGNSGVQLRSTLRDDKKFVVAGPQADIGEQYWGSLHGEGVGGTMKSVDAKKVAAVVKPKEFNEYKIVAKGTRITITINGETMVDDDFKTLPAPKGVPAPPDGVIAFQAHSGYPGLRVEFKEIKFKNLGKK
jgi:hypothetical protein